MAERPCLASSDSSLSKGLRDPCPFLRDLLPTTTARRWPLSHKLEKHLSLQSQSSNEEGSFDPERSSLLLRSTLTHLPTTAQLFFDQFWSFQRIFTPLPRSALQFKLLYLIRNDVELKL
mmetsp:Transcript_37676/g.80473  ORF Transcript_37676/g.80473 Transcript_37676/m.80473 type:complete len:119 (-) Transcript_37676:104-460(-)